MIKHVISSMYCVMYVSVMQYLCMLICVYFMSVCLCACVIVSVCDPVWLPTLQSLLCVLFTVQKKEMSKHGHIVSLWLSNLYTTTR